MVSNTLDPRVKFLETAAHHYALSATPLSAHLMQQRNNEPAQNTSRRHGSEPVDVCRVCGTIRIPGRTLRETPIGKASTFRQHSRDKSKGRGQRDNSEHENTHVKLDCLVCYRYEKVPIRKSERRAVKMTEVTTAQPTLPVQGQPSSPALIVQEPPRTATVNANSKQRAKARKQGGLQAMLEKSKASAISSSGFGLDLMDLMEED